MMIADCPTNNLDFIQTEKSKITLNEIRNSKWIAYKDWRVPCRDSPAITKFELTCFVENIARDIARRLGIPYSEFYLMFKEENSAFYSAVEDVYKLRNVVNSITSSFDIFKNTLRIPDVDSILTNKNKLSAQKVISDFSKLSDEEKLVVLRKLKICSVRVDFFEE